MDIRTFDKIVFESYTGRSLVEYLLYMNTQSPIEYTYRLHLACLEGYFLVDIKGPV